MGLPHNLVTLVAGMINFLSLDFSKVIYPQAIPGFDWRGFHLCVISK